MVISLKIELPYFELPKIITLITNKKKSKYWLEISFLIYIISRKNPIKPPQLDI